MMDQTKGSNQTASSGTFHSVRGLGQCGMSHIDANLERPLVFEKPYRDGKGFKIGIFRFSNPMGCGEFEIRVMGQAEALKQYEASTKIHQLMLMPIANVDQQWLEARTREAREYRGEYWNSSIDFARDRLVQIYPVGEYEPDTQFVMYCKLDPDVPPNRYDVYDVNSYIRAHNAASGLAQRKAGGALISSYDDAVRFQGAAVAAGDVLALTTDGPQPCTYNMTITLQLLTDNTGRIEVIGNSSRIR